MTTQKHTVKSDGKTKKAVPTPPGGQNPQRMHTDHEWQQKQKPGRRPTEGEADQAFDAPGVQRPPADS